MIIVSQNKISITNFDNVTTVEVNRLNDKEYRIKAHLTNKGEIFLAIYKTEERAKEVLEEIIKAYIESVKAQETTSMFGFSIVPSNTYYEMPKE